MPCGRCAERGRAIRHAVNAAAKGDGDTVRRNAALVARSLTEDTKAFAKALRAKLGQRP